MGTETRIGIATGLLIVVVASVYFFRGRDRSADDLLIVDSAATELPTVPPRAEPPGEAAAGSKPVPAERSRVRAPRPQPRADRRHDPSLPGQAPTYRPTRRGRYDVEDRFGATPTRSAPTRPTGMNRPSDSGASAASPAAGDLAVGEPTRLQSGPSDSLVKSTETRLNQSPPAAPGDAAGATPQKAAGDPLTNPAPETGESTGADLIRVPTDRRGADDIAPKADHPTTPRFTPTSRPTPDGKSAVAGRPSAALKGADAPDAGAVAKNPAAQRSDAIVPTAATAATGWPRQHRIEADDTLSEICDRYYGTSRLVAEVIKANPHLKSPNRLQIGEVVILPPPPETSPGEVAAITPPRPESGAAGGRTYTVRSGDSFYTIARSLLGTSTRWKELFERNRSLVKNDPTRLRPGMVLSLPE